MSWRLFKQRYISEIIILGAVIILAGIFAIAGIPCVIYYITGVPCPACGMTRAMVAILKGDLQSYMEYNLMALPVALAFLAELFQKAFGKRIIIVHIVSAGVLCINLIYYFTR